MHMRDTQPFVSLLIKISHFAEASGEGMLIVGEPEFSVATENKS